MPSPFLEEITLDAPEGYEPVVAPPLAETFYQSSIQDAPYQKESGFLGRRIADLTRGIDDLGSMAGGSAMAIGAAFDVDFLKKYGIDTFQSSNRESQINAPRVGSFENSKNPYDFLEYATEVIAGNIPQFLVTLPMGFGVGAIASKSVGAGVLGGVTRETAKGLAKEWIEKYGEQQAAKMIAKRIAIGQAIGAYIPSAGMETGQIAGDIFNRTGDVEKTPIALGAGSIAGALEMLPELQILKNNIGQPITQNLTKHWIEKFGIEPLKTALIGAGTEGAQSIIEQVGANIVDPARGILSIDGMDVIDSTLQGFIAEGAMATGAAAASKLLTPSQDPITRIQEDDVTKRAEAKLPDEIRITEEDLANAEDLASTEESPTGGVSEIQGQEAGADKVGSVQKLADQLIIANDKKSQINKQLDELLLKEDPTPEEVAQIDQLQIDRKDAIDDIKILQGKIAGINPEDGTKNGKPRKKSKPSPFFEVGLPAPNPQAALDFVESQFPQPQTPEEAGAHAIIRESLKPFYPLLQAFDIPLSVSSENPDTKTGKSQVSWDDEGNVSLKLNQRQAQRLSPQRMQAEVEHEIAHIATILHDRKTWIESSRPIGFREWAQKQSDTRAQAIRAATGDTSIRSLALAYGLKPDLFSLEGKDEKGIKEANRDLDRELTRAVIQKLRTGKFDEELKVLERMEAEGNVKAGSFLEQILAAVQRVKDILITYINKNTAPKSVTQLIDGANYILDRYETRIKKSKAKPVEATQVESATSTLPEEKKPTTGNVAQTEGQPDEIADQAKPLSQPEEKIIANDNVKSGDELFPSTEYGQFFETRDFRNNPTGVNLIRAKVPYGKDPEATLKATPKYRELLRRGRVFRSGDAFEIPKDAVSAGEEIPVDERFSPDAFRGIESGKSRSKIVQMPIQQFLDLAAPIQSNMVRTEAKDSLEKGVKWESIPQLMVENKGEIAKVTSHEGRHRAMALQEAGYLDMPVEIRSYTMRWGEQNDPESYDYSETFPTEIEAEKGGKKFPFPFTREQASEKYIPTISNDNSTVSSGEELPPLEREFTTMSVMELQGISNVMKSRGTKTGYARNSKVSDYVGENNPHLNNVSRAQWVSVDKVTDFLAKNGFEAALEKAAEGSLNNIHPADRLLLRLYLADKVPAYRDQLEANYKYNDAVDKVAAIEEWRDGIWKKVAEQSKERGQEIGIFKVAKEFLQTGERVRWESRQAIFNAAAAVEKSLSFGSINSIHEAFLASLPKAVDEVFTKKELLAKLSSLTRSMIQDPEKLLAGIRKGIQTRKRGWNAAFRAAAKAGEEMMREGGQLHLQALAKRIADRINQTNPTSKKGENILSTALSKFAADFFPKDKVPSEKDKNRNMKILGAIIVNDNVRNDFINSLETEIAKSYAGGKNSAGFKRDYAGVFDEMRQSEWSDNIRIAALNELKKNMGVTVAKMLTSGDWENQKAKVITELSNALPDVSEAQVKAILKEFDSDLDQQAEQLLNDTFGFKRNEDGTFSLTKAGNLQTGTTFKTVLRELGLKLKDLTKMSLSSREAETNRLAEMAINRLGLPPDMAMKFQAAFAKEIKEATAWTQNREIEKKIQQITEQLARQKTPVATNSVIDKIIEFANQGFLSHETIYESIRQQLKNSKLPVYSPKVAEMVQKYADEMEYLPEGEMRNAIRQKIANELANSTQLSTKDILTSYWYYSMLSGPSTWLMANPVGNATNLVGTSLAMAADNPRMAPRILKTIIKEIVSPDSTSWQKFSYTMQTGLVPMEVSAKYGVGPLKKGTITELAQLPVERITKESANTFLEKALYYLARYPRFGKLELSARSLSRFMAATDMFFRQAGYMAAMDYQNLGITDKMIQDARKRAAAQVGSNNKALIAVRGDEIIRQELSKDPEFQYKVERAEQIALDVAFTENPKGMIGSLAKFVGELGNTYAPVKMLVPFTNIVANVWNQSIDWTPFGAARYANQRWGLDKGKEGAWAIEDPSGNFVANPLQLKKAIIGTAVMAGLFSLFGGDDPDWELVGNGPKDKRKRQAFFDRGMRPYTMRIGDYVIGYQAAGPLASMIGMVGTFLDMNRENKGKDGWLQMPEKMLFSTMASLVTSQLSQSFFSSASSMFQAMYSPSPGSGVQRWVAGQVGTVVPNVIRQINNDWIDNGVYQSSTFQGQVLQSMGVTKSIGNLPKLNMLGDPIKKSTAPLVGRLISFSNPDPTFEALSEINIFPPQSQAKLNGVDMTDEQQYEFTKTAGPLRRKAYNAMLPTLRRLVNEGREEEAQDMIDNETARINSRVKMGMIKNLKP